MTKLEAMTHLALCLRGNTMSRIGEMLHPTEEGRASLAHDGMVEASRTLGLTPYDIPDELRLDELEAMPSPPVGSVAEAALAEARRSLSTLPPAAISQDPRRAVR